MLLFFLLLFCVGILAVFVCPWQNVFGCHDVVVFVSGAHKHNYLVLSFFRCVFLVFFLFFFARFTPLLVIAALLLCFLLCWFGRFPAVCARFVCLFLSPFDLKAIIGYCAFSLLCYSCFCCLFGLLLVLLFVFWCPSVTMRVQQCPPCVLPCLTSPTCCFPLFHTTNTHPSDPCVYTYTLLVSAHAVMSVIVFFPVFACLLLLLCVCACLCLRLLVCLCLFFVFVYVYMVALYAHACA